MSQKFMECTMVSVINGAIKHGYEPPTDDQYMSLMESCGSLYGTVITVRPVIDYYKLKVRKIPEDFDLALKYVSEGYPVLVGAYHKSIGHHSCTIVESDGDKILVPNFCEVTDKQGWISVSDFKEYLVTNKKNILPLKDTFWVFFS